MKNSHSHKKQEESGPIKSLSESKRLSHLSGIKIVINGKIPSDIKANTEIDNLLILPTFTLCACYQGGIQLVAVVQSQINKHYLKPYGVHISIGNR
jgi:hypothetical protein